MFSLLNFKTEKGSILIDALISLVILAITATTIMLAYNQLISATLGTRLQTDALMIARQHLESIKQYDQNNFDRNSAIWNGAIPANFSQSLNNYTYNVAINFISANQLPSSMTQTNGFSVSAVDTNNNLTPIRVTVSWIYKGRNSAVTLDSYMIN